MLSQPRNLDAFEQELAAVIGKHFECQPVGLRLNGNVEHRWEPDYLHTSINMPEVSKYWMGYVAAMQIEFAIPEATPAPTR